MVDNLSIAVYTFCMRILTSLAIYEIVMVRFDLVVHLFIALCEPHPEKVS